MTYPFRKKINPDDPYLPEGAANNPAAPYNQDDEEDDWYDQRADDAYDSWKYAQMEINEE